MRGLTRAATYVPHPIIKVHKWRTRKMSSEETKWETVETVLSEIEANIIQGYLESSGVDCVVEPSVYRPRSEVPLYSRYKINVPEAEVEKAREVLAEIKGAE